MSDLSEACPASLPRLNMVQRRAERWKPPVFTAGNAKSAGAGIRRFFDLQAGSIWRDLKVILGSCSGTVLDVGCGAQPYRALLPPEVEYIGIDTADAKAHFGYEIPDTRYFDGNVWPVDDGSVDTLLCTETLEHIIQPEQFLSEASRCLKRGGRLVLTVPFAARWHYIPFDYWRYTPSGLEHLLLKSGFGDIEVYARGGVITVACYKCMALILPLLLPQTSRMLLKWLLRLAGLLFSPLLIILAALGTLSLNGQGGDDCLGYTALAKRNTEEPG